ncbi:MAG: hypothetical protein M1816_008253 [Peltula sp. TS41687]|nr:MAG: hypothetical protein M1816_008253 [Peltula sp. TS41687]
MASNLDPYDDRNKQNLYFRYKSYQGDAFNRLFPNQHHRGWTLKQLYAEAARLEPRLEQVQRDSIITSLEQSTDARKNFSSLCHFAPSQSHLRHAKFIDLLDSLIKLLKAGSLSETEAPKGAVPQQTEALQVDVTIAEDHVSVDDTAFLCFLEDIELLVDQAVDLWRRVAEKSLGLSTASTLTSKYLCEVTPMLNAESILNPSWFKPGGPVATCKSGLSSYWDELQTCAPRIADFLNKAVSPLIKSELGPVYAPVMTQMLCKGAVAVNEYGDSITVSKVPLSAVTAASFVNRCNKVGLDLDMLRKSVETECLKTQKLIQTLASLFPSHNNFGEALLHIRKMQTWANNCCDAVSFGTIMGHLKAQVVLGTRYYLHEVAALQLFAYMCERVRIGGKELPPKLEELFNFVAWTRRGAYVPIALGAKWALGATILNSFR